MNLQPLVLRTNMSQDNFNFEVLRTYIEEETGNKILVCKLTDYSSGFSVVVEGIHEHKVRRKSMKKIQQLIKDQERANRIKK